MSKQVIAYCVLASAAVPYGPMPRGKPEESDSTILYLRGAPKEVARKLKAAAALQGKSLTDYVKDLLQEHVRELEKKGMLPKGKG